jgi:hypothetical protein
MLKKRKSEKVHNEYDNTSIFLLKKVDVCCSHECECVFPAVKLISDIRHENDELKI